MAGEGATPWAAVYMYTTVPRLQKAGIIPTVLDVFPPSVTLSLFYENATVEVGNTIDPSQTQKAPDVHFIAWVPDSAAMALKKGVQLTIALTDPDAPSREEPEWSEICHWIATGVPLTDPSGDVPLGVDGVAVPDAAVTKGVVLDTIMEYKPPGPPPKTGKHRYVFVALAPVNGTTEPLFLSKPKDRQHWGYKKERQGLRKWAGENGLEVIGANFIYAQNEKQS
ncbi:carboxypeptidase Y inhibitor [Teratosphaeriaceae sp. CCFEE 6253]|nr:carboxypeptidase Y inhibitor [Teratosphaeriaceae sp. CCFEE 6253]